MRVGIDIDDVLYPWFERAQEVCDKAGITNGVRASSWHMWEDYGCSEEEWADVLGEATFQGTLYDAPPMDGVDGAMRDLGNAGHTLHLVTARGFMQYGTLIRAYTVQWLSDWGVPHDTLTFAKDKTLVAADVFVDDGPHNVAALHGAGRYVALVDAPHNQDFDYPWRVGSFVEFVNSVLVGLPDVAAL